MSVLREFRLPDLGEGLTESEIVDWRIAPGDRVSLNQVIADVETAKAVVELPSPVDGLAKTLHAQPGDTVEVGTTIVTFEVEGGDESEDQAPVVEPGPDAAPHLPAGREATLVGYGALPEASGHPARRPRRDTVAWTPITDAAPRTAESATAPGPDASADSLEQRIPVRGVRRATAQAMVQSAFTAPQATVFLTVDATPTAELLGRLPERPRIGLLAVVARALCTALRAHPELNARWDEAAQEIVRLRTVQLGIAVATGRGLLVPALRDAHALALPALAVALAELVEEARSGLASAERLTGGTITISNVGVFGVDAGTPILPPGQAAILAVGALRRRPWEYGGAVALRETLTLSLSFDHRVVDGEKASRFLAAVGELIADPALALVRDGDTGPLPLGGESR